MLDRNNFIFEDKGYKDIRPINAGMAKLNGANSLTKSCEMGSCLLLYIVSGSGNISCSGKTYAPRAGEIFVSASGGTVSLISNPDTKWNYIWIQFSGSVAERFTTLPPVLEYKWNTFFEILRIRDLADMREEHAISKIFEIISRLFPGKSVTIEDKNYAARVCDFIETNYMNPISVAGIADDLSLNRHYLTRLFKEKKGMSLQHYIIDTRMKHALELLRAGYSVSEAANMVGYGDPFTFSRMFKKKYGKSPNYYKRK